MKQVLQSLKSGETAVADVPCPRIGKDGILIQSACSLVSVGTERMLLDFGKAGLLSKALQQPDKVRQVVDKMRTDGLVPTLEAVRNKLDQPLAMGYCNVGRVLAVGAGVDTLRVGDRVVSNGKHAEVVSVPKNLCVRIPDDVSDQEAAFTILGAIALQGIRLLQPTLGENVVVLGVGLIGLLAVQLLRANGCRVLAVDLDDEKLKLAESFGAEVLQLADAQQLLAAAQQFSRGRGTDAVLIAASTSSSLPIQQAAQMCRKRGRIVLVGVTGLELSRADFYEKEISFQVSCSYGPGRYDPAYEENGHDYPVGFVRWTEQRNFEAVLDMMASRQMDVRSLISHRFPVEQAEEAYELIGAGQRVLGILLTYEDQGEVRSSPHKLLTTEIALRSESGPSSVSIGLVGSGNYATSVLIPAFQATGARLRTVVSGGGVSSLHAGKRFGFEIASTSFESVLDDPAINTVVIATRHNAHAAMVCAALEAGKHVFVEKPLATTLEQLAQVRVTYEGILARGKAPLLMVGFNRRFAPHTLRIRELLQSVSEPKAFVLTVNAGAIPPEHWTQDSEIGGGRIIGEGCHFFDLLRFLAGVPVSGSHILPLRSKLRRYACPDTVTSSLAFEDGSVGTVHYLANGNKAVPKERLDVFCGGRVLQLDNFRKMRGYGWAGPARLNLWRQDKGQSACAAAFVEALEKGLPAPIPIDQLLEIGEMTIRLAGQART